MKGQFCVAPEHLGVIGNDRTVQDILVSLEGLKSLGLDERYDLYSELYREGWATDAGYVLLPGLWESLDVVVDPVDLELAFVTGSIQRSAIEDPNLGAYSPLVEPYLDSRHLEKCMDLLLQGRAFCSPNLPDEECRDLIAALVEQMAS